MYKFAASDAPCLLDCVCSLQWPTTKYGASDAANEQLSHTGIREKSTKKTIKLTCALLQFNTNLKKEHATAAIALKDQLVVYIFAIKKRVNNN